MHPEGPPFLHHGHFPTKFLSRLAPSSSLLPRGSKATHQSMEQHSSPWVTVGPRLTFPIVFGPATALSGCPRVPGGSSVPFPIWVSIEQAHTLFPDPRFFWPPRTSVLLWPPFHSSALKVASGLVPVSLLGFLDRLNEVFHAKH